MTGLGITTSNKGSGAKSVAEKAKESPKITFQVMSDLHLEQDTSSGYFYKFKKSAKPKYLILAGDIGRLTPQGRHQVRYREFLVRQCSVYERVFLIAGNRKFPPESIDAGLKIARGFAADPGMNGKLTFMENDRYDFHEAHVIILGCTLWSRIRDDQPGAIVDPIEGNTQ